MLNILKPLLDKAAAQRLYLLNYLTDQQDFNYTNCLFQISPQAKIKPVAIDLEKAFMNFPSSRGEMYEKLFKEIIDAPIEEMNHPILKHIANCSWEEIVDKIQGQQQDLKFSKRIEILKKLYLEEPNNFFMALLYKEAGLSLY